MSFITVDIVEDIRHKIKRELWRLSLRGNVKVKETIQHLVLLCRQGKAEAWHPEYNVS